jgi:hypothetical protein
MPPSSDDQRIRKGLKFLTKADTAVIRAAVVLEKLEGDPSPQGPADLLHLYAFDVGAKRYAGRVTTEQNDYLQGYTGNQRKFADALARILLSMNRQVPDIIKALSKSLKPPTRASGTRVPNGGITPPPLGCCTYDNTKQDGVSQSFCEGGLQGHWDQNPCPRHTPGKSGSAARGSR